MKKTRKKGGIPVYRRKIRGKLSENWYCDLRAFGGAKDRSTGHTDFEAAKAQAKAWIAEIAADPTSAAARRPDGRTSMRAALALWHQSRELRTLAAWEQVHKAVERFVDWAPERAAVEDVDVPMIQRWLSEDRSEVSLATQKANVSKLSGFFRWCRTHGHVDPRWLNPARDFPFPRSVGRLKRKNGLTSQQVTLLLEAVKGHPQLLPAYLLAFFGGAERKAIVAMRWRDVDFVGRTLRIPCQKNRERDRRVPLLQPLAERLLPLRGAPDDPIIAKARRDSPAESDCYTPQALENMRSAHNRMNPDGFQLPGFHLGRHTIAGMLLRGGVPLHHVSLFLGHSTVTITQAYYAHHVSIVDEGMRDRIDGWDFSGISA